MPRALFSSLGYVLADVFRQKPKVFTKTRFLVARSYNYAGDRKAKFAKRLMFQQLELFNTQRSVEVISAIFQPKFTFLDLFAGIGGFRIPLEELGGKCLGYSEIDQKSIAVYRKNFITYANADEEYLGDIQNLKELPFSVDAIAGGVPCQPWSIAGKLKGLNDPRGQLWLDTIRVIVQNRPKAFILENVKGLTEPRNQQHFDYILTQLRQGNYCVKWQVLNSYDFGVPQDRDRVFIVGIRRDIPRSEQFIFPSPLNTKSKLYDVVEGVPTTSVKKQKFSPDILFGGTVPPSRGRFQKADELNDFFTFSDVRNGHTTIHSWELVATTQAERQICETILKNRRKKQYGSKDGNPIDLESLKSLINGLQISDLEKLMAKKILRYVPDRGYEFVNSKISAGINGVAKIYLPHSDVISTLTATGMRDFISTRVFTCQDPRHYKQEFIKKIYQPRKFKKITPRDAARLQGFPDWFILDENPAIALKQLGNAVSVPVIYYLAKSLLSYIENW